MNKPEMSWVALILSIIALAMSYIKLIIVLHG